MGTGPRNRRTAELVELIGTEIVINLHITVPSHETNEAIRFAAQTEAMITDPVYEGKSMQGMIDLLHKGFFPDGSRVLYASLGGARLLTAIATRIEMVNA